ncbi:MAG: hypothetical protein GY949_23365 [Gammaproteobacteria bacterium]|nr:hypothetical protein [Gammaproteobacteria bacterium]
MTYPWWRRLLIILPIGAGIGILAYFISKQEAPEQYPVAERVHHVRVVKAADIAVMPTTLGYGTVRAARVWNAVAPVSGEVEYVHPEFKAGAILEAGTEIVRISPRDLELEIQQVTANIRATEAKISELQTKVDNYKQALIIEEGALALNKKQLERKKSLVARGTVAKDEVDEEQRTVLAQRQKVLEIKNALRLLPAQIEAQEKQKAVYESQLASAELSLERTHLRLPFAARISAANVEATQFVQTGADIGSADSTAAAEIEVQIPQSLLQQFIAAIVTDTDTSQISDGSFADFGKRVGLRAVVRLSLGTQTLTWNGAVVRIGDAIDAKTRTVSVVIRVDEPYKNVGLGGRPPLTKGTFVEVMLVSNPVENRVVVPRSALSAGKLLVVDSKSRLQIRDVETSFVQGNLAIIAKGAKPGEQIVVSDLIYANDGMLLKTQEDTELAKKMWAEAAGPSVPQ